MELEDISLPMVVLVGLVSTEAVALPPERRKGAATIRSHPRISCSSRGSPAQSKSVALTTSPNRASVPCRRRQGLVLNPRSQERGRSEKAVASRGRMHLFEKPVEVAHKISHQVLDRRPTHQHR